MNTRTHTASRLLRSRVVDLLVGPHGIDRYLELIDPSLTVHDPRAQIVHVRHQTARSVTLTLRPNDAFTGFAAGQFVKVGVEIDGVRRTRTYSPASAPADPLIELTVTLRDGGVVSRHLIGNARAGTTVHLSAAGIGAFTLPDELPDRVALVSGGSGITPTLAMLRTLLARRYSGRIDFLHFARTRADQLYRHELHRLAGVHPNLRSEYRATREGDDRFAADTLAAGDTFVAVCGPPALIDAVGRHHPRAISETFFAPSLGTAGPEAGSPATGTLHFTRTGTTAPVSTGTLLEQAEAAGLHPVHGCRRGICHSCTCRKTGGAVRNLLTGAVSTEAEEDIQICISVPAGDVALDL